MLALSLSALSPAASVFITGSGVLHMAGTGAALALILGGIVTIVAALVYAELGSAFPRAGGLYPGISGVLGPGAGFVAMSLMLCTAPAFLAFIALGFADYVRVLAPVAPKLPLAFAALLTASLLSVLNIRINAWITGAFLLIEMLTLALLAAVAGLHPVRGLNEVLVHPVMLNAGHLTATKIGSLALATLAGAYACSGSHLALYFSEEIRGAPQRIGGIVVLTGVMATAAVTCPLVLLTLAMPDVAQALSSEAPIAQFLTVTVGPGLAQAAALAVALAILNNVIAALLALSRLIYSTARDGVWPKPLSRAASTLHPRFRSPWLASLGLGVVAILLCLIGERSLLIVLSGEVFSSALVVVAVLVGRRRGLTGAGSFRLPFYPLPPVFALLMVAGFIGSDWMDSATGRPSLLVLAAVALVATVYWRVRSHQRRA